MDDFAPTLRPPKAPKSIFPRTRQALSVVLGLITVLSALGSTLSYVFSVRSQFDALKSSVQRLEHDRETLLSRLEQIANTTRENQARQEQIILQLRIASGALHEAMTLHAPREAPVRRSLETAQNALNQASFVQQRVVAP